MSSETHQPDESPAYASRAGAGAGAGVGRGAGAIAPVLTLVLLSPILAELLSGSVRLSTLFVLIPATGVWGCAALLIREVVRRRGRGYGSILLLGLALAVAEECIIQQTSLAPLIGVKPGQVYSRALGVNWEYLLWALGFESVWAFVAPIALTELLFPDRRSQPWLRRRGIIVAASVMALCSFIAWYSWTQVMLPKLYPDSVYHVPWYATGIALLTIAVLSIIAVTGKPRSSPLSPIRIPCPWILGPYALALSLCWYLQVLLAFGALRQLPPAQALVGGCLLAIVAGVPLFHWTRSTTWRNAHRLALILGLVAATMAGGNIVLQVSGATTVDRIAQVVFGLVALVCLARLAFRVQAQRA